MNTTTELQITSSSYSAQQNIGIIEPEIEIKEDKVIKDDRSYPFRIIGPWVSKECKNQSSFGLFWPLIFSPKMVEEVKEKASPIDIDILESAKKYYEENKEALLKKYRNKYIAILNNKVVESDKDFSKLAQRVYAKYGYQTIYMPFVDVKEKVVKIPSPRIKIL